MAGQTNQIAVALAAIGGSVAGVNGSSPVPVDTIPSTPYFLVGPPKWTQVGGSWEVREYHYLCRLLIARLSTEDRDQTAINDLLDLVDAAFRSGITLGGALTVASTLILSANTDKFYAVGTQEYQSIDMDVQVIVMSGQTYTP